MDNRSPEEVRASAAKQRGTWIKTDAEMKSPAPKPTFPQGAKRRKDPTAQGWPSGYQVANAYTPQAVVYHGKTGHMPLQDPPNTHDGHPIPSVFTGPMMRQNEIYRDRRDGVERDPAQIDAEAAKWQAAVDRTHK